MKTIKSILLAAIIMVGSTVFAQKMMVDTKKSTLKWYGEKVTGSHWGNIDLKEGWFKWENDKITKGMFVIDMNTITNKECC